MSHPARAIERKRVIKTWRTRQILYVASKYKIFSVDLKNNQFTLTTHAQRMFSPQIEQPKHGLSRLEENIILDDGANAHMNVMSFLCGDHYLPMRTGPHLASLRDPAFHVGGNRRNLIVASKLPIKTPLRIESPDSPLGGLFFSTVLTCP
jgi:hypothetical protein